jgi:hypothetical protein
VLVMRLGWRNMLVFVVVVVMVVVVVAHYRIVVVVLVVSVHYQLVNWARHHHTLHCEGEWVTLCCGYMQFNLHYPPLEGGMKRGVLQPTCVHQIATPPCVDAQRLFTMSKPVAVICSTLVYTRPVC